MNFQERYDNYLMHFGVPGMKWGVRKSTYKSLNRRQRKALKAYSERGAYVEEMRKRSKTMDRSSKRYKKTSTFIKNTDAYRKKLERVLGTKINNDSSNASAIRSIMLQRLVGGGMPGVLVSSITRNIRANKQSKMTDKDLKNYLNGKKKK